MFKKRDSKFDQYLNKKTNLSNPHIYIFYSLNASFNSIILLTETFELALYCIKLILINLTE